MSNIQLGFYEINQGICIRTSDIYYSTPFKKESKTDNTFTQATSLPVRQQIKPGYFVLFIFRNICTYVYFFPYNYSDKQMRLQRQAAP